MKTFNLEIRMDNEAFSETPEWQLGEILRDIASRVEDQGVDLFTVKKGQRSQSWSAVDTNGNTVGEFRVLESRR